MVRLAIDSNVDIVVTDAFVLFRIPQGPGYHIRGPKSSYT
jgi:hypothetical protein